METKDDVALNAANHCAGRKVAQSTRHIRDAKRGLMQAVRNQCSIRRRYATRHWIAVLGLALAAQVQS